MLKLSLLGGFNIELKGQPLSGFSTDKARALLAYLVIERERPHRRESLAGLFWPEQPEERARQSLRQALSNLRKVFNGEDSRSMIVISNSEVQLNPQAETWMDVDAFNTLLKACREHPHANPETCLPCLRRQQRAESLYTGELLKGFSLPDSEPFEEWLMLTRENLQAEAMQVLAALAVYEERRGNFKTARRYALKQVHLEPWREEAHAQTMRLLAYEGQRSAALSQYAACRCSLQTELGLEPTQSTRMLAEQIQNNQLPAPKLPRAPVRPLASFIGREKELDEITELLATPSCRLLTLVGPGGVGKTRLALQTAIDHTGLYRDGIHFIHLSATTNHAAALLLLAEKLGLQIPPGGDPRKLLCEALAWREMLVVLDNFEQLASESQVWSDYFCCASGTKWIVTSREKLQLREEWVYGVQGLEVPPALTLFVERTTQADRHFELTSANLPDVTAICEMVEGLPLGLELAAAATSARTVSEIAAALHRTFDSLRPDLRNLPERHASLRAVFENSWDLLTPDERDHLAALSVFVGGFDTGAAERVAEICIEQLGTLAAKSLLRRNTDGRYALHETVRQFAAEKLTDGRGVWERHGVHYASLAVECAEADSAAALDTLQVEHANLRAAWEWSLLENVDLTANLLQGLALLYTLRGPLTEGEELLCGGLEVLGRDISKKELAEIVTIELARIYNTQTRYDEAMILVRALPRSARALLTEAQSLSAQGQGEAARPILAQALAMSREAGDRRIEADCLRELGNVAKRMSAYDIAVPLYRQALELAHELGDRRGESATLNNWATVEWELGDLPAARKHYEQALTIYRALGNHLGEARALNNLSNVLADRGDLTGSLVYSRQALQIHREMGNPRGQCAVLQNLGATYFCLKEYDAARTSYLGAMTIYRESGNRQAEAEVLANLGLLDCVQGRLAQGRENARAAIALSEAVGDSVNLANALYYLGRIELGDKNFSAAESVLTRALELRRKSAPHPGRLAEIQAELSMLAFEKGNLDLARERIGPVLETLDSLEGAEEPERIRELAGKINLAR